MGRRGDENRVAEIRSNTSLSISFYVLMFSSSNVSYNNVNIQIMKINQDWGKPKMEKNLIALQINNITTLKEWGRKKQT